MSEENAPEVSSKWMLFLARILHIWFLLSRGMTLGVRAACFDGQGRVFLVKHGYMPGWYLPGGGVEWGETMLTALAKEIREEGNLVLTEPAQSFGLYLNRNVTPRDHVQLYVCRNVEQTAPREPDKEIIECGFFEIGNLPEDTTPATRRRLAEIMGEAPISEEW
ncbi:NUDIX domain-containing protein [Rhizobium sp. L1K21]|uniref:NUDIX domain-containing protein n=1 Tax=Rhizobium sp. L1K21 TaxID=2954933 RepID=UPI0020935211|nr:NUDIX domain-containing protein [Rhizobium sp. L1K21]MCO6185416.1 NUDIX domain-containing protein [Rhizobium sp. L1K21]